MRLAAALVSVAALFGLGCAEPNTLSGSISQSHDLTFEEVQLRLLSGQAVYELQYLLPLEGGGNDVIAKIVFNQPEGGIKLGDELDLKTLNVKVERITAGNDPFPAGLEKAVATFTEGGSDDGEATKGEFSSTFDNGKTLNGTFEGDLEVIDF